MGNEELKKKIADLKNKQKERNEEIVLTKQLKLLEEETREKSKSEKVLKGLGKGFMKFGKKSAEYLEKQAKKQERKAKKK